MQKINIMNSQDLPPRKKRPGREEEDAKKRVNPDKPDAAKESNRPVAPESPSKEEVISNWSEPVTNQDEQDKITNAPENDIPLADK
jgi:hypothetical protein